MPESSSCFERVVFCDSGLGGVNVAGRFLAALRTGCRAKELDVICFNAWPRPGIGFNQLPDLATKLAALRQVNEAIAKLQPALVVYACNTISTLLADGKVPLPFPAATMLDAATDLLASSLRQEPKANLLICGTTTTAESHLYARRLEKQGLDPARIAELACPGLATQIEYAPDGAVVRQMIADYARQAVKRFTGGQLLLGLCCTHFGYTNFWQTEFSRYFDRVTLLDPNAGVVDALLPHWRGNHTPRIAAKLLTRVEISPQKRAAIAPLIAPLSPELEQALRDPVRDKDLFIF